MVALLFSCCMFLCFAFLLTFYFYTYALFAYFLFFTAAFSKSFNIIFSITCIEFIKC